MPDGEPDIRSMSAATYAATADHFDAPALSFWDRFGRETVTRIGLRPADRVLDACCGTGASALPAARLVGPTGRVIGADVAEPALALARAKAHGQGLTNAAFRTVDIERTGLPSGSFDAVVCVLGVFFLPDMAAGIAEVEVEPGTHPLADPEDWWTIVLGTGYRATVERLGPPAAARVRAASVGRLRGDGVREVETNVVYARVRRPAD